MDVPRVSVFLSSPGEDSPVCTGNVKGAADGSAECGTGASPAAAGGFHSPNLEGVTVALGGRCVRGPDDRRGASHLLLGHVCVFCAEMSMEPSLVLNIGSSEFSVSRMQIT